MSLLPPQHRQHDWLTGQTWSLPKGMYVSGIRDQKTQSKGSQSLQDRLEQLTASTDPKVCFGRGIKRPSQGILWRTPFLNSSTALCTLLSALRLSGMRKMSFHPRGRRKPTASKGLSQANTSRFKKDAFSSGDGAWVSGISGAGRPFRRYPLKPGRTARAIAQHTSE